MGVHLITGQIGAGKTSMAVQQMAGEVGGEVVWEDRFGQSHNAVRRILVAGVRGLVVEHERLPHPLTRDEMDWKAIEEFNRETHGPDGKASGQPVYERLADDPPRDGVPICLQTWWLWCKPGDKIYCDELQYMMPRGAMGRVSPVWVRKLEVSRHYGVDFVFISQHPELLDMPFRKLVTLHQHVRPGVFSACVVYSWDHASNPERLTQSTKSSYVRKKSTFKLYKSTVAVTKQAAPGRLWLLLVPVLIAVGLYRGWSHIRSPTVGEPQAAASASSAAARAASGPSPGGVVATFAREDGLAEESEHASYLKRFPMVAAFPRVVGCYTVGLRCSCVVGGGRRVPVDLALCRESAVPGDFDKLVQWRPRDAPVAHGYGADAHGYAYPGGVADAPPPPAPSASLPALFR